MVAERVMVEEQGQVTPLMALVVGLAAVALLIVARMGHGVVEQVRAQAAADAAALAGVATGPTEASNVAGANGGQLESFTQRGAQVQVRVRVGAVVATATAELVPVAGEAR